MDKFARALSPTQTQAQFLQLFHIRMQLTVCTLNPGKLSAYLAAEGIHEQKWCANERLQYRKKYFSWNTNLNILDGRAILPHYVL